MKKLQITLFLIIIFSCNGQEKKLQIKESENIKNNENMKIVEEILKRQLEVGMSGLYDETADGETYKYESKDLDVIIPILKQKLESSGYKFLDSANFNSKIKTIFGRIINSQSDSKYLYISPIEKCERELFFYRNKYTASTNPPSYYVIKKDNFLTELYAIPELIDYQKEYPNIAKIEDTINVHINKNGHNIELYLWKNEEDLSERRYFNQQLLINRNKYLFNDSKASFAWLKFNDEYFLESLVKTFGYTTDKDLLNWVMQKNRSKAEEFIKDNVFVRNCKGELEIREGILKYIEENTTNNEKEQAYVNALYSYDTNDGNWTEKEYYKILAYKANTYDYLFMKYRSIGLLGVGRWNILGNIFYYSDEGEGERWKKIEENFKSNNYYNLPHLKEVMEYAYGFDSVGSPD